MNCIVHFLDLETRERSDLIDLTAGCESELVTS